MRTVIATEDYEAAYPDPLMVRRGETLIPARWDEEWPGWVWCSNTRGVGGWFPERLLNREGGEHRALADFDGTELSFRAGDTFVVESDECGWLWCRNAAGERGWVPSNRIRPQAN